MWTLWGPGSRLLFWLGRLPTAQACRLFACPATRRPVHIKPWQKLVNQHHNAHHCNPSTVCRGFGPSRRPWSAWPFKIAGRFLLPPWRLFLCTTGLLHPCLCFLCASKPIIINIFPACACVCAFRARFCFFACCDCCHHSAPIIK